MAVAHPAATAFLGRFVHARLTPTETVFVGGGAGNVGTAAVRVAALAGGRVIAGCRPEDVEHCRRAGADTVLDCRDEHVAASAPHGVDILWDTSGQHDFGLITRAGALGARVLVTAAVAASPVPWQQLCTRDVLSGS